MVTSRERIKEEGQHNKREQCPPTTSERRKTGEKEKERIKKQSLGTEKQREREMLCQNEPESCSKYVNERMTLQHAHISLCPQPWLQTIGTEYNLESWTSIVYGLSTEIDHFGSKPAGTLVNSCCLVENPLPQFPWGMSSLTALIFVFPLQPQAARDQLMSPHLYFKPHRNSQCKQNYHNVNNKSKLQTRENTEEVLSALHLFTIMYLKILYAAMSAVCLVALFGYHQRVTNIFSIVSIKCGLKFICELK